MGYGIIALLINGIIKIALSIVFAMLSVQLLLREHLISFHAPLRPGLPI